MPPILTTPDDVTPVNLTAILREFGVLSTGAVVAVGQRANLAFNSQIAHLYLTYSSDVPATVPTRLVLKRNLDVAWAVRANAAEVMFYRFVNTLPFARLPMILRPLAAAHDATTGRSQLLLPDLSETHVELAERARVLALDGVPTDDQLDAVVDTLAAFHAYWWEHSALGTTPLPLDDRLQSREGFERYTARIAENWEAFSDEGPDLPSELRACCEFAVARLPRLWDRFLAERLPSRQQITLCHNDCYFAAFLCPRTDEPGQTFIIDWQGPEAGIAAHDLVYLFATFWTPAQRHEGDREERLLRRYHAALVAHGVADYTWDDLARDYRLMLIFLLFLPIWDAVNGSRRAYWWPKLTCLAAAYRDWRCAELLD